MTSAEWRSLARLHMSRAACWDGPSAESAAMRADAMAAAATAYRGAADAADDPRRASLCERAAGMCERAAREDSAHAFAGWWVTD